jgi:hypothetical protein
MHAIGTVWCRALSGCFALTGLSGPAGFLVAGGLPEIVAVRWRPLVHDMARVLPSDLAVCCVGGWLLLLQALQSTHKLAHSASVSTLFNCRMLLRRRQRSAGEQQELTSLLQQLSH